MRSEDREKLSMYPWWLTAGTDSPTIQYKHVTIEDSEWFFDVYQNAVEIISPYDNGYTHIDKRDIPWLVTILMKLYVGDYK